MERSSKRGKIPQQDWPSIMARYEAGETLATIARTYDCSPPAISYIVSRSRARAAAPATAGSSALILTQPQLVKGHPSETPVADAPHSDGIADGPHPSSLAPNARDRIEGTVGEEPLSAPPRFPDEAVGASNLQNSSSLREGDGLIGEYDSPPGNSLQGNANEMQSANSPGLFNRAGAPVSNNEPRRTLHLSLSHGNDVSPGPEQQSPNAQRAHSPGDGNAPSQAGDHQRFASSGRQGSGYPPRAGNGVTDPTVSEPATTKDGRSFIDQALRERVESDIAAFLSAFDAALTHDTTESRAGLRAATDRLLRAGARTRIELERLEARVPLSTRNDGRQPDPAWRQR
jgi:hypothetical protein